MKQVESAMCGFNKANGFACGDVGRASQIKELFSQENQREVGSCRAARGCQRKALRSNETVKGISAMLTGDRARGKAVVKNNT